MNNIGGNLPILVDPLAKAIGYRESVSVFYAGFYLISKSIGIFDLVFYLHSRYFPPLSRFGSVLHHHVLDGGTTKSSGGDDSDNRGCGQRKAKRTRQYCIYNHR